MLSSHTSRRLITMEKVKEFEDKDQYAHLEDGQYLQYQGHNSFREKYFSGLTKRMAREERARAGEQNCSDFSSAQVQQGVWHPVLHVVLSIVHLMDAAEISNAFSNDYD